MSGGRASGGIHLLSDSEFIVAHLSVVAMGSLKMRPTLVDYTNAGCLICGMPSIRFIHYAAKT